MRGDRTRRRRLLVTLALLLAGAGVRHVIELHARRVSIAEREPVAALPSPSDPPDAEVSPALSPRIVEEPREPLVSATTSRSSAASSISRDSDGPTTAPSASDPPTEPVSAAADAQPAGPSPPAPPVPADADAQSTRQFPPELQEQAANNAAGWVYEIEPGSDRRGPISPEQIIGAWRIDDQGAPTGEYVANSRYRPSAPKRRRKSDR
jgi:hypothetical protein